MSHFEITTFYCFCYTIDTSATLNTRSTKALKVPKAFKCIMCRYIPGLYSNWLGQSLMQMKISKFSLKPVNRLFGLYKEANQDDSQKIYRSLVKKISTKQ